MTEDELFQKLLLKAGAYTAKAEHSPMEVENKLYAWGGEDLSPKMVSKIILRLKSENYIDEKRYAGKYTRDKVRLLHKGPKMIRRELFEKGIRDKEIIREALDEISEEEWMDALHSYLSPKLRSYTSKARDERDLSSRLYRAAYARGFEDGQIRTFLKEHFAHADIDETEDLESDDWD